MNEKCKRENTNEITCPHCDYEFSDSYEYIPSNSDGEIDWLEDCPECEKQFNAYFDARNIDNGYTTSVLKCKPEKHNYIIKDKCYFSKHRTVEDISKYSRIEVCSICDDWKFIPVKEDGSDFTKEELTAFRLKNRLEKKSKLYFEFKGKKTGSFSIEDNTKIKLKLKEPEGNIKIWVSLCRFMKQKGFKPQKLPDYLRKHNVSFKKDWLECDISVHNYALEISFYQNEIMQNRKKAYGRYEYNKYQILTPAMQTTLKGYLHIIKKHFINNGFDYNKTLTDKEFLLSKLQVSKLSEWNDPKPPMQRDILDANKKPMKSGDLKYFYDGKLLRRGIIYWNNGNQWFILCNGELKKTSHFYLFDYNGEPARKPLKKAEQIQRLHTELTAAEKNRNYKRCIVLWDLLKQYKLYNVWSIKHSAWWGKNNSGYTDDRTKAGVYTHENITENASYYNDGVDSVAKEIINN